MLKHSGDFCGKGNNFKNGVFASACCNGTLFVLL